MLILMILISLSLGHLSILLLLEVTRGQSPPRPRRSESVLGVKRVVAPAEGPKTRCNKYEEQMQR